MAKVIRIFEFSLNPDVQAEDFERFIAEELRNARSGLQGVRLRFLKCDRDSQGEGVGKYANELEFESIDVRDRYFPKGFEGSEAFGAWWAEYGASWDKLYTMIHVERYRDYIEYEE